MKKIDKDPFSNGTEFVLFEDQCCDHCIKASRPKGDGYEYTNADEHNMPNRCSIQRDIVLRMASDEPINERTIKVCYDFVMEDKLCPYMVTHRKRKQKQIKNQLKLL